MIMHKKPFDLIELGNYATYKDYSSYLYWCSLTVVRQLLGDKLLMVLHLLLPHN